LKTLFRLLLFFSILFISCTPEPPRQTYPNQLFNEPQDLICNKAGTIYVTNPVNNSNNNILSISSAGIVQPFVNIKMQYGCPNDGESCFYASVSSPSGIAIDSSGNIYFGDDGCEAVYKINASNYIVTKVAGNGSNVYSGDGGPAINAGLGGLQGGPGSIAIDNKSNLYVVNDCRIRKVVLSSGIITTVAGNGVVGFGGDGGPAISAQLSYLTFIAVDDSENIYISDVGNYRIRKVTAATSIFTTIAGNGISGYNGDSIPATAAALSYPEGIKVDAGGNIYFNDHTIVREIKAKTNIIYTVAGGGNNYNISGSGIPATYAGFGDLFGLSLDNRGNFYIINSTSYSNDVILKVNISTGIISSVIQ